MGICRYGFKGMLREFIEVGDYLRLHRTMIGKRLQQHPVVLPETRWLEGRTYDPGSGSTIGFLCLFTVRLRQTHQYLVNSPHLILLKPSGVLE